MRISYSALETFKICPAKYKYQYLDKIKVPKSKQALFGTLIHDCLKMFHEPSRPTPPLEDELLKYFTEKWDSSVYQDEQEEAFAFHQGIQLLKRYYLKNQKQNFNIVNLEMPFQVPVAEEEDLHQITGRIDRIDKLPDGSFEVIDYKTAKKMPPQETVDKNLQLSIYYLGMTNRWPFLKTGNRPVKLSLYYLIHDEKLSTVRNNQQVKESQQEILSIISQIKNSDFEPRTNPLCPWCFYQPHCPLFRHKYKSPAPDDKKIKEIIQEYFQIKDKQNQASQRLAQLKEEINRYLDQQGLERIFGQSGQITRLPQKRFSYDFNKVKEILEPLGKWEAVLTIDSAKFKKLINQLPYPIKSQIEQTKKIEREFKVLSAKGRTSRNSRI